MTLYQYRAKAPKYFDYSNSGFPLAFEPFSLLALFIFVIRNKNEPKNARPAKLATLKQYRGLLFTYHKLPLFPI